MVYAHEYQNILNIGQMMDLNNANILTIDFIEQFKYVMNWYYISEFMELSDEMLDKFKDKLYWNNIIYKTKMSDEFIIKYQDYMNLHLLIKTHVIPEYIIERFIDKVNWSNIIQFQVLSEDFIRKHENEVDWFYISAYQHLSEEFIREFKSKVNWDIISKHQCLSEDFIREFEKMVIWEHISISQKLSAKFIEEFQYKLDIMMVCIYQNISLDLLNKLNRDAFNDNLYFKSYNTCLKTLNKYQPINVDDNKIKQEIMNTSNFECHDNYFIGYKAIRANRYSKFNFQYQYLKGDTYVSKADFTDSENSFGLSIGSKAFVEHYKYNNDIVVKIKCYYKDVARIVHDGEKIRVTKIEVLD